MPPAAPEDVAQDLPAARLARLAEGVAAPAAILDLFDALPAVTLEAMQGRWRGEGLPSGHPMDGLLETFGWYGKAFHGTESVQPLLARGGDGAIYPINPALLPIGLVRRHAGLFRQRALGAAFARIGRLTAARGPTARLRMMPFRGVVSAAMIYDRQPIIDHFRLLDADALLGVMDLRGLPQPFFFVLRRDAPGPVSAGPASAGGAA